MEGTSSSCGNGGPEQLEHGLPGLQKRLVICYIPLQRLSAEQFDNAMQLMSITPYTNLETTNNKLRETTYREILNKFPNNNPNNSYLNITVAGTEEDFIANGFTEEQVKHLSINKRIVSMIVLDNVVHSNVYFLNSDVMLAAKSSESARIKLNAIFSNYIGKGKNTTIITLKLALSNSVNVALLESNELSKNDLIQQLVTKIQTEKVASLKSPIPSGSQLPLPYSHQQIYLRKMAQNHQRHPHDHHHLFQNHPIAKQ